MTDGASTGTTSANGSEQTAANCAAIRVTDPPRTATEQYLLTQATVHAIEKLSADGDLCREMGDAGYKYVCRNFDRERLSRDYVRVIRQAIQQSV